ncbi:MAG: DUF5828 family protein [Candidatus Nanohaloarchaea archaeon]|nr:DUF5828 family protein [Candidatus Nanohaloarchaea archaeon]
MRREDFRLIEEGSWEEVADFCSDLSEALSDTDVPEDSRERFDEWRPGDEEEREDVRERTAREESLGETETEKRSEGTARELSRASSEVKRAGENAVQGRPGKSVGDMGEAGKSTVRGLVPMLAKLVRGMERGIYRHLVGRTNPDYFEGEGFSVSIDRNLMNGEEYTVSADFRDEEVLSEVEGEMEDRE